MYEIKNVGKGLWKILWEKTFKVELPTFKNILIDHILKVVFANC